MKYLIICAAVLVATTLATLPNAQDVAYLAARAIDPKTMDPTRLSVLSVLRTAVPSDSVFPQPTGDVKPEWYQKLPEDVKSLLPLLYPAVPAPASASVSVPASSVSTPASSSFASNTISLVGSVSSSLSLCASQITVTKTLQAVPSVSTGCHLPGNSSFAPTNGIVATALPSPSGYFSAGARTATNVAALVWIGVGTGFFAFA